MALLDPKARESVKPFVNGLWTVVVICLMIALGSKYILSGYPPALAWLEPFNELIISLGLIGGGVMIADRNPLIK